MSRGTPATSHLLIAGSLAASLISCGPPPPDPAIEAAAVLQRALEAMGGADALAGIESLAVAADCTGPEGPFNTEVLSIPPDRTLFRQTSDERFVQMVISGDDGWLIYSTSGSGNWKQVA